MLVLSRKCHDAISFPQLDITIEILKVKGAAVRVGIDAPMEINILRGEVAADKAKEEIKRIALAGESEHDIRNSLNTLSIGTATVQKYLEMGETNLAATALHEILSELGTEAPPTVQEEVKAPKVAGKQALLIEDITNERELLAGFLRLHGFVVHTANDGVEALEYLEDNDKPDFLLMDMNLPRLDGATAIRKIRENPGFDPMQIFAVSGKSPSQANVDLETNRISAWFQKPLSPADFIKSINQHVNVPAILN